PVRLTLHICPIRSQVVSRYWMTSRHLFCSCSALSRIRTCTLVTLIHAPLPVGLPERIVFQRFQRSGSWRDSNPHLLGANQASCRVGRRTRFFKPALREGFEPSSPAFGGPCSDPIELPQQIGWAVTR